MSFVGADGADVLAQIVRFGGLARIEATHDVNEDRAKPSFGMHKQLAANVHLVANPEFPKFSRSFPEGEQAQQALAAPELETALDGFTSIGRGIESDVNE